jgi:hypothetical protein
MFGYGIFSNFPATSIDFGCDGYTGSCNEEGELLQMTAPCNICGVTTVKGDFENAPDAVLARSQRRYPGKSTFGLKIKTLWDPTYQTAADSKPSRGIFNFRVVLFGGQKPYSLEGFTGQSLTPPKRPSQKIQFSLLIYYSKH